MKKIASSLIAIVYLLLFTLPAFSQEYGIKAKQGKQEIKKEIKQEMKQEEKQASIIPWIWLGANVLAAGATTYFTIDALNAKNEYEKQLGIIDNTTMDNYNKLLKMKNDTEGKLNLALISGAGTFASVLANILFQNPFEDKKVSTGYNPKNNEIKVMVSKEF